MIWLILFFLTLAGLTFIWGIHVGAHIWRSFYLDEQAKRREAEATIREQSVRLAILHRVSIERGQLLEANQALAFEVVRLRNIIHSPIPGHLKVRKAEEALQ